MLPLVVLLASLGAAPKKKAAPPPPPPAPVTAPMPKVEAALGSSVLQVMQTAGMVKTFRVDDAGGLRPDPARAIASDFVRGQEGLQLDAAKLEALRSILYDEKSYRFDADTARCTFVPHLSFSFVNQIERVEAVVSFSCNQVVFIVGKTGGRWLPKGRFDVRPARAKLLALAKDLLPADAATQRLK